MKEKTKTLAVKPPSKWFFTVMYPIVRLFLARVAKIKRVNEIKKLKAPYLIICNHQSPLDIFMLYNALFPKSVSILTARDLFTWGVLRPFVRFLGMIPKSQNSIDIAAMRTLKSFADAGNSVCVYPEGKISLDGTNLHYVAPAIAKLIKFLGLPVVMHRVDGLYNSSPRFHTMRSRGRVAQKLSLLLTADEVKSLSNDEIYTKVWDNIRFNDCKFQADNNLHYKCKKPAAGLDLVLYKCPKCGADYTVSVTKTHINCSACNNSVRVVDFGNLVPESDSVGPQRVDLWYAMQRQAVKERVCREGFYECHKVEMELVLKKDYEKVGEGEVYISDTEIGYKGTKGGEEYSFSLPIKFLSTIILHRRWAIDLSYNDIVHRFNFADGIHAAEYGLIVEEKFKYINGIDQ